MFTALIEPILTKRKFNSLELLMGGFILVGLYFVYLAKPDNEMAKNFNMAIAWGIFSSFVAAVFSVLNMKWIPGKDTRTVSSIQLLSGFFFLCIALPVLGMAFPTTIDLSGFQFLPNLSNSVYLIILSILCTTLAFVLELNALKRISAFVANLVINLEPIYGIIMAALFFKEHKVLNIYFYIGACIILASVFLHPVLVRRKK